MLLKHKGILTASRFVVRGGVLGAALLALAGCGAGTGDLSGTVTYKNKPLHQGTVLVLAADGSSLSGLIRDDGSYSITGVPQGMAKIGVSSQDPKTVKVAMRKKGEKPPPPDTSKWVPIPERYADVKESALTTPIGSGKNTFGIELK